MPAIDIDDDVYAELEGRIESFGDTPNLVLRRLLGLESRAPLSATSDAPESASLARPGRHKAPKADLVKLVRAGHLREGQRLFLVDHQGLRVPGVEAVVHGRRLKYRGKVETMSALTARLMEAQGYRGGAYRGPKHWVTEDGESVMELWAGFLQSGDA